MRRIASKCHLLIPPLLGSADVLIRATGIGRLMQLFLVAIHMPIGIAGPFVKEKMYGGYWTVLKYL
jgi:hypothetical protein